MKNKIISVALAAFVFLSSVVPVRAVDPGLVLSSVSLANTLIQQWIGSTASSSEKAETLRLYKQYWYSSLSSSYGYVDVSYDALSDALFDLNDAHQPARIVYSPNAGGYVIQSTASFGYYAETTYGGYKSIWDNTGQYFGTPTGYIFRAPYNSDSVLDDIKFALSNYPSQIAGKLSTISDTLTDKLTSMESSLTRLLSRTLKTDQNGTQYTLAELVYNLWQKTDRIYDRTLKTVGSAQYTISDLQYNTWQQTERAAARLLKTVDNVPYTVADLQYNTWQQTKNAVTKLSSIDTWLSTLHTDASSLGGKLDNIADLLNTTTYTCGYKSNAAGTAYPTQTIPYDMAVQIAARINSEMLGKQMTVIKQDGSGTTTATISRCLVDSSGYIIARSASAAYYLCGKDNTIFVAAQDYVKSIYSRMTDVISAVNNLTVGVDLSDVQLSVDASSINLFNNTAYCCGYQTDADGNLYPTLPIPYDSAAAILERLNTDYVDKKITVFSRSGAATSGYLRSASITSNGYIRIALTNGYTYFLCDNTNVLYLVDASSNYGSRANDSLLNVSSKLDAILDQMQSTGGEYTCQHTYSQEMEQEPTCILPGLMVSTCSKCGNSYSEIVGALDHDWVCTEHVEAVTDPDTEEVTQAAYDIYTCSRCGQTYEDHTGDGAPTDYGETSIAKIIVKLFAKLGTFAGKIISWVVDLFTKTLGGVNDLFARFTELTAQITSFGGDYPTWLTGFWGVLSSDLQLALSFAFLCTFVGIIGKKLFFS